MTAGKILYTVADGVCLIRMEGRVTYASGPSFSAFIDGLFGDGTVTDVVVDLSQAVYLDSTTLGLLGRLVNATQRQLHRKVTAVAPCDDVNTVLTSMGFDAVLTILKEEGRPGPALRDIPVQERSERERAQIVLDAHRRLMDMSDANAARFRDVVEALEQEIAGKAKDSARSGE